MKYQPKKFGEDCQVDWTPMIDVTFQLIAFFMFTMNFSKVDFDQSIALPISELAKPSEEAYSIPITVQVRADGRVVLSGRDLTVDEFRLAMLTQADVQRRLGKSPTDITIIIRADGSSATGRVQEVIRKCQEAEFQDFVLRAKQGTEQER